MLRASADIPSNQIAYPIATTLHQSATAIDALANDFPPRDNRPLTGAPVSPPVAGGNLKEKRRPIAEPAQDSKSGLDAHQHTTDFAAGRASGLEEALFHCREWQSIQEGAAKAYRSRAERFAEQQALGARDAYRHAGDTFAALAQPAAERKESK
jgi:hypothetical protein